MGLTLVTDDISNYNRREEVKAFDETKAGVKGLVDAKIKSIPKIFVRPEEDLAEDMKIKQVNIPMPTIDLSGIQDSARRKKIIEEVRIASQEYCFFQVVNHGIPIYVLDEMIEGLRLFNEQDLEEKKKFHTREFAKKVRYNSNYDLFESQYASWRDSLTTFLLSTDQLDAEELPPVCSKQTIGFAKHINKLAESVLELLSESMGLKPDHLKSLDLVAGLTLSCHYYPACPNPELTLGAERHSDPGSLTLLIQNQYDGLQIFRKGQWVNVRPSPGGIICNLGDLVQIISNDKLISIEQRVIVNHVGPRISVACVYSGRVFPPMTYKPIEELTSEDDPPRYKEFSMNDYVSRFLSSAVDGKSNLDYYRI